MVVVVVVGAPSSINVETNEGQIGVYFMVFSLHNPDIYGPDSRIRFEEKLPVTDDTWTNGSSF